MVDVEAEVSKYRNCRDRDKLEMAILEYKNLARQHAVDLSAAGQYSAVAFKLQEICNKLPPPTLKNRLANSVPTKTASITNEENARIRDAWKHKTNKR
jgi:hypothetical protein